MDDIPGARAAYEERLALAESVGDPVLIADGHYDLGFVFMVAKDADTLRHHEGLALEGYLAAGRESEAIRARQAFVLALMLAGDYATAREQQEAAIAAMRRRDSHTEVADSQTLLSSILFRLGLPRDGWREMSEALRFFAAGRLASGTARAMVVAAIIDIVHGDPERGARIAGVTYELSRAHNVMLAPITVLHMPDPRGLAVDRLGADRTERAPRDRRGDAPGDRRSTRSSRSPRRACRPPSPRTSTVSDRVNRKAVSPDARGLDDSGSGDPVLGDLQREADRLIGGQTPGRPPAPARSRPGPSSGGRGRAAPRAG